MCNPSFPHPPFQYGWCFQAFLKENPGLNTKPSHFVSFFSRHFYSFPCHQPFWPFWPFCPILPPPMGDPSPPAPPTISFRSDEPIWPKEMISTCVFQRFLEKNLYVVIFPIFGHLGVRTPPLASSTKDLTTSRSFLAVFSSSSYGRAWPDLVQRRSYDLTLILVHPTPPPLKFSGLFLKKRSKTDLISPGFSLYRVSSDA